MVSIPSTPPQAQEQIITNLQSALHQSEVLRKQLVHELTKFKEREQWEKRLFANPHISASQKLALWATTPHLTSDNFTHVNITYVSKQIGMSPKTTGRNLQEIAEAQGLQRDTTTIFAPDGTQQTKVLFAPTEQTRKPHLITPPTPRNHGGKRYCKDCGSDNLIEQTTITCMDCGAEQHRSRRLINQQATDRQLDYTHSADQHIDHDIDHSGIDIARSNNIDTINVPITPDTAPDLERDEIDHSGIDIARSNNIDTTINIPITPDTAPDLERDDVDHGDNHGTSDPHDDDDDNARTIKNVTINVDPPVNFAIKLVVFVQLFWRVRTLSFR